MKIVDHDHPEVHLQEYTWNPQGIVEKQIDWIKATLELKRPANVDKDKPCNRH